MRCAGVTQAQGSGQVGLGVQMDVASASGSLRQLVFHVRDLVTGGGLITRSDGERSREARRLRVQSGWYFMAMLFDN